MVPVTLDFKEVVPAPRKELEKAQERARREKKIPALKGNPFVSTGTGELRAKPGQVAQWHMYA